MKSRISLTSGCTLLPEPPLGCRRVLPIAALRQGTPSGAPPGVRGSRSGRAGSSGRQAHQPRARPGLQNSPVSGNRQCH
eukprot:2982474-Rhodomonas_salina.1